MIDGSPIIGISGASADSASVRAAMTQIRDAGAIPLFLSNHAKRDPLKDIEKIDGLVVLGNNADIDPERYGAKAGPHTKSESATPEGKARADYEYMLLAAALDKKVPLLGICGGMQRLNVFLGGSLHQHVPDLTGNDLHAQQDHNIAPFIPVQAIVMHQGTTLSEIAAGVPSLYAPAPGMAGPNGLMENSMHHQAVDRVGRGLRVSAVSTDGIVQAIEPEPGGMLSEQFVLGVQWHPEFGASAVGPKLAQRLVSEACKHRACHPQPSLTASEVIQENFASSMPVMTGMDRYARGQAVGAKSR